MQRRAVVTVFDAHRDNMDAISLTSDLMSKDILTAEQCQELLSLNDKNKRHEALLYTLLACNKLVECMKLTGTSIAADLQGMIVLNDVANCLADTTCYTCSVQQHSRLC